jgi:hypothetical protein
VCTSSNGQVTARTGPGEVFGIITFLATGDVGTEEAIVSEDSLECLFVAKEIVEMLTALHPEAGLLGHDSIGVWWSLLPIDLRGQCIATEKWRH